MIPCSCSDFRISKTSVDHHRRETVRGLVDEDHLRLGHQSPAHGQHLLLAAAQRPRQLARPAPRDGGRARRPTSSSPCRSFQERLG